jgi:pilus assembly protein CpaC
MNPSSGDPAVNAFRTLAPALAGALIAPILALAPAPRAEAFELIAPETERTVSVIVGTGQLIRVDAEFSSLFVANPDVADIEVKSPRLLYLTGVGVGETSLFAVDEADNVLMSATVRVTHNTDALSRGLARVAPGQSVTAMSADQSLVLTGKVASAEQAADVVQVANQFVDDPARVVNRLEITAPIQVSLQVRIAEVSRNIDRQIGIKWNNISYSTGGGTRIGFFGGSDVSGGYGASVTDFTGSFNVNVVLQALSEEGLVTILAEPNLTARSGESARFLAGGEFPYTVAQEDGANTIEFKDFGIGLSFTPTVLDGSRISLKVATEVSDLDFSKSVEVPSLQSRRAETTVDLASGQSFAIAGLMQNSSSNAFNKVPGAGSLPVIGALFRSNSFQRGQTELVIIVTPVIVSPTAPQRLSAPTDRFIPPNDVERVLLGRYQGNEKATSQVQSRLQRRRLNGASGFVFD